MSATHIPPAKEGATLAVVGRPWRTKCIRLALSLCLFLWAGLTAAQDSGPTELGSLSMEDLAKIKVDSVYGASKFLQKAKDAATSLMVITGEEIQRHGFRTLADVLRSVRGFYVINDRNYSYVGVRGLSKPGDYNARILFLLDGHRVNDNIFDGAYVGIGFPVDIDLIERIEITRGPNSSVYGTGAFFAVINVITKRGRDLNAAEVSTEAGSLHSYKGRISYGTRVDSGLETIFSASFFHSDGQSNLFYPEFDNPANSHGVAKHADAGHSYSVFGDVIYRDFNFHVVHSSVTKHIPTASFATVFNDSRTRTTDSRSYIDAQYHRALTSWEVLGRVSYDWYDYHGIYVYDYAGNGVPPYTENYDAANGAWVDFQGDLSRVIFSRHSITIGSEFRQDVRQQQVNYDIAPYQLYLQDRRSSTVFALYFQDKYSLHRNLTLVMGLRGDWHRKYGEALSPRLGLHWTPAPNADVSFNYSRAFRAPNSFESFYTGNLSNSANLALRQERISSWELDIQRRFAMRYSLTATGFVNRMDDLIEQRTDILTGRPSYVNSDAVQTKGVEIELEAAWPGGLKSTISHSLQDTRNQVSGNVLANSPKQVTKVTLDFPLLQQKLFAGIDAQYVSKRRTVAQTELGGFGVMNLTFSAAKLTERLNLSAGLYNLFDKRYADSGGLEHVQASIPQNGRGFRIKLTYRPYIGPS